MLTVPARSDAVTTWKRWILGPSLGNRGLLYEEAASLVGAGIGVREALADLTSRARGARRRALLRLSDAVAHGVPTGEALLALPEYFAPVEARIVAAGERTGRLDRAFRDAAAEVQKAKKSIERFARACAYPLFLAHFALFVPACALMTNTHGWRQTQFFIWSVFAVFWAAVAVLTTVHLSRRLTPAWGRVLATLPLVGPVSRSGALARACRVAALLHDAGEDISTTLTHAAEASANGWVAEGFSAAAQRVAQGMPVTAALVAVSAFGPEARSLIETGEQSGNLDESFRRIAEIEDERYGKAVARLAVVAGGVVFLGVGLWVFLMFASLLGSMYGGIK